MQQNYLNNYPNQCYPVGNPNAVNINIYAPQAYGANPNCTNNTQGAQDGYYSMYGANTMPNLPLYPQNYNAPISYNYVNNPLNQQPNQQGFYPMNPYNQQPQGNNQLNPSNQTNMIREGSGLDGSRLNEYSSTEKTTETSKNDDKKKKDKVITPLTDDYIKNLENYMNSSNSKIRLIGIKEVMERFKEDENRKDNKSLIPLLNKALQDTNSAIRFLALTTLQLGYSVGDDTTVQLLTHIANNNLDKFGQDALLASEVLLKLSAPQPVKVQEGENK